MGPTGLFCALELAQRGVKSILLDRGRDVIQRRKDVAKLMRDGTLMPGYRDPKDLKALLDEHQKQTSGN